MTTTRSDHPSTSRATPAGTTLRNGAGGALAAAVLNAALWVGGRAGDVSFDVTPIGTDASMEVDLVTVLVATLVGFGAGWALLARAGRRSEASRRAVLVAAAVVAVASAGGPLAAADDTATGVVLACMHLLTGAVFVATAWWHRRG